MRLFRRWDRRATQLTPHRRPHSTLNLGPRRPRIDLRLIPSKEIGALLRIRKPHATLGLSAPAASLREIMTRAARGSLPVAGGGTAPRVGFREPLRRAADTGTVTMASELITLARKPRNAPRRRAITAVMTVDRACEGRTSVWDGLRKSAHLGRVGG